jgi:hypothetical protein
MKPGDDPRDRRCHVAELIVLAIVVGAVFVIVATIGAPGRRRSPHDQPAVTDTRLTPPPDPDGPVPGSRPQREAHRKP